MARDAGFRPRGRPNCQQALLDERTGGAMRARRALLIILAISVAGIAFSGTLSYRELCLGETGGCPVAPAGSLFGVPVCVYGLLMYLLVGLVAALGLRSDTAPAGSALR